jgi:hypothetical protein
VDTAFRRTEVVMAHPVGLHDPEWVEGLYEQLMEAFDGHQPRKVEIAFGPSACTSEVTVWIEANEETSPQYARPPEPVVVISGSPVQPSVVGRTDIETRFGDGSFQ